MSRCFNKSEVAAAACVSVSTLLRHIDSGAGCPGPDTQYGLCRAFSEQAREAVLAYFVGRKRYERFNKKKTNSEVSK